MENAQRDNGGLKADVMPTNGPRKFVVEEMMASGIKILGN